MVRPILEDTFPLKALLPQFQLFYHHYLLLYSQEEDKWGFVDYPTPS